MSHIAFLGLGAMGSRMAFHLLEKGHQVTVYNRSPEPANLLQAKGAKVAATPKEAATGAAFIISMVRDDKASENIWLDPEIGALLGVAPGTIMIESSTVTPTWIQNLAEHAKESHAAFLDAPVAGSRPQADAAQLIFLVGGEKDIFNQAQPLFAAMGSAYHHVGRIGAGATTKLAVNAYYSIQVAALAETLSWLEKSGISLADAVGLFNTLPTVSPALQGVGKLMAAENYDPLFPVSLVAKDLNYVLETTEILGARAPIAELVSTLFSEAEEAGFGNKNIAAIKKLY